RSSAPPRSPPFPTRRSSDLKSGSVIIANVQGFDAKNLKLAKYPDGVNPLENGSLENYVVHQVDITKLTKECLSGTGLGMKEIERDRKSTRLNSSHVKISYAV